MLTIIEVRDGFQNVAVGIERLWPTDTTGGVPVRVQDNLRVYKVPGGDSLVQSTEKSDSSRHGCELFEGVYLSLSAVFIAFS